MLVGIVRAADLLLEAGMRVTQLLLGAFEQRVRPGLVDQPVLDQPARVELARAGLLEDLLRHQRLRVRRLVPFAVAEAAVADEVDEDVVAELVPVRHRQSDRRDRSLGVVGVDVDDRDVEALGQIAGVARGSAFHRIGGEADLVVGDDVERAARGVPLEVLEVEGLRDDPLAGEGCVAVDQDRQRHVRVVDPGSRAAVGLLRAGASLDDGVDGLEMARVRRERDLRLALGRAADAAARRGGT